MTQYDYRNQRSKLSYNKEENFERTALVDRAKWRNQSRPADLNSTKAEEKEGVTLLFDNSCMDMVIHAIGR